MKVLLYTVFKDLTPDRLRRAGLTIVRSLRTAALCARRDILENICLRAKPRKSDAFRV
jgi:hypothetical protein